MSPDDRAGRALTAPMPPPVTVDVMAEGRRVTSICNACRYCEGYCAAFPALERRLEFDDSDLRYLANLCHNCGACLTSCQYAPPHEFALNLPRTFAQIRGESHRRFAWPAFFSPLYRHGLALALVLSALFAGVLLVAVANRRSTSGATFYDVIPHATMAGAFGIVAVFVAVALAAMFVRAWRDTGESASAVSVRSVVSALRNAASLRNLRGGGEGCAAGAGPPSTMRRLFHHMTAYGFLACFAATVVATWYHYVLRWPAPYPLTSAPVVLGILGGIGLLIGPAGLAWLAYRRDAEFSDPTQAPQRDAFLALLFLVSATGLALLAWRATSAMPYLLAVHLGIVMALFVTLPYGKFVHAIYRLAALLRDAVERQRPSRDLGAGG